MREPRTSRANNWTKTTFKVLLRDVIMSQVSLFDSKKQFPFYIIKIKQIFFLMRWKINFKFFFFFTYTKILFECDSFVAKRVQIAPDVLFIQFHLVLPEPRVQSDKLGVKGNGLHCFACICNENFANCEQLHTRTYILPRARGNLKRHFETWLLYLSF